MAFLWQKYMLMNYRKKKEKAMMLFPAYSKAFFLFAGFLKYAFIFLFFFFVAIIGKEKYEVALLTEMILLFFFLLQAILIEGVLDVFDSEYGLINHFLSGMYSNSERKRISWKIVLLIGWDRVGVFFCGGLLFLLAEIIVYKKNAIVFATEVITITLLFIVRTKSDLIRREKIVKAKNNWTLFSTVAFAGCVALRLGIIEKVYLPKTSEAFLKMICTGQSTGLFLGAILLCSICCNFIWFIGLKSGEPTSCNHFKGVRRHFFEKEIKGKVPLFFVICMTLYVWNSSWLQAACMVSVVSAFLFSVFNNRFLLGEEFLFMSALSNSYKVAFNLAKATFVFPVVSVGVGCLIVLPFNHLFLGVIVAELVCILTMILQGVIYRIGCRAIRDCLSQVEFLGGGIYIAQLFVVVALL